MNLATEKLVQHYYYQLVIGKWLVFRAMKEKFKSRSKVPDGIPGCYGESHDFLGGNILPFSRFLAFMLEKRVG